VVEPAANTVSAPVIRSANDVCGLLFAEVAPRQPGAAIGPAAGGAATPGHGHGHGRRRVGERVGSCPGKPTPVTSQSPPTVRWK
jgi:hypothetical protein